MFDIGYYPQSAEPAAYVATASPGTFASVLDETGKNLLAASSPAVAVSVEEGHAITAYVKLNRKPKSEVRISFASSGLLELDVHNSSGDVYRGALKPFATPPVLIFDNSNWNIPQTVSIESIDDHSADGTRTLPVRMSISTRGRATITRSIWVHSLDSRTLSGDGGRAFHSTGAIGRTSQGGQYNGMSRLPEGTVSANYDGTKGTAKFVVNSGKPSIRKRVIEVDYAINAQNKVMVRQVRGIDPRDLFLDLNYLPLETYHGSFGLSGEMTIRQPKTDKKDSFFVTSLAKNSSDINQYVGKWYVQGSARTTASANLVNAAYTYTLQPDATVKVEYGGSYGTANGATQTATGIATPVLDVYPDSTYTQFNVSYSSWSTQGVPSGDYRIVDFAPDYSWAIASDSFGRNGVILTRAQIIDDATYTAVLYRAKWLGVDTSKFTRTIQISPP